MQFVSNWTMGLRLCGHDFIFVVMELRCFPNFSLVWTTRSGIFINIRCHHQLEISDQYWFSTVFSYASKCTDQHQKENNKQTKAAARPAVTTNRSHQPQLAWSSKDT